MILYICALLFIYIFILITGFHDEGNLIATVIFSKSLTPKVAFVIACISQFVGTVIIGNKVAKTMAFGIIKAKYIVGNDICLIVLSGILGAILWNMITWHYSIPSSSSHAIVGGIIGPFVISFGFKSVNLYPVIISVLLPLFLSPVLGYLIGFVMMRLTNFIFEGFSTKINKSLKNIHVVTMALMNMAQGSNDAQKGIGVILMLLISRSKNINACIPFNVKLISGILISAGLMLGGFKMIKAVGTKVYKVKPMHSFNAQLSSLLIIFTASKIGAPISGTQVVNSTIVGVGAAERPNAVGWQYAKNMVMGWIITIPSSFLLSSLVYLILKKLV